MFTLAMQAAMALLASPTGASVDLSDVRILTSPARTSGIATDGDTAYLSDGTTIRKIVYGANLKVVDSLPSRGGSDWFASQYVPLSGGLGLVTGSGNGFRDTAVWLVDWNRRSTGLDPASGSRWRAWASGPAGWVNRIGTTLRGQRQGDHEAIFVGSSGAISVKFVPGANGTTDRLDVVSRLAASSGTFWDEIDIRGQFIAGSIAQNPSSSISDFSSLWQLSDPVDPLSPWVPTDSSPMMHEHWQPGRSMPSDSNNSWLHLSRDARQILTILRSPVEKRTDLDSIDLPIRKTARDTVGPVTAVARTGMRLIAGDSSLVILDWDGLRLPTIVANLQLNNPTLAAAFGDSTLWIAGKNALRAYRMHRVEDPSRAQPRMCSFDGSNLDATWTPSAEAKGYIVQVTSETERLTFDTQNPTLRVAVQGDAPRNLAARSPASAPSVWWRVAPYKTRRPSTTGEINALPFSSWQPASAEQSAILSRQSGRVVAMGIPQGIRVTNTSAMPEEIEFLDASGRLRGRVMVANSASAEFHTSNKGLMFVRHGAAVSTVVVP